MKTTNPPTATGRILIIDDNPEIHNDFRKVLQAAAVDHSADDAAAAFFGVEKSPAARQACYSFDLVNAMQGMQGLDLLKNSHAEGRPFDMAFVDMRMPPGWDGLQTIEKLWQFDPNLQIVICSAFSDHSWQDLVKRLGVRDSLVILKKPFDHSEVLQLACALTQKRKLARMADEKFNVLERIIDERTAGLRIAHEESERLLAAISSALIGIDENGIVQRWNEGATRMFGIDCIHSLDRPFTEVGIAWEAPEQIAEFLERADDKPGHFLEPAFHNANGQPRIAKLTLYPISRDGTPSGSLLLGSDVTERKTLEVNYRQAQKLEAVGQLAAGVAHEINTPMQYIGDNLSFLKNGFATVEPLLSEIERLLDFAEPIPPEALQHLKTLVRTEKLKSLKRQIPGAFSDAIEGVEHVSRIVRAMKEFSHPGVAEKIPVDLNRSLESTLTVATNEWKHLATVQTEFMPDLPAIDGFPGELNQVFLNLIVNAAHAIGDARANGSELPGVIRVTTGVIDGFVRVSIEDNGCGIPAAIKDRVFEQFFTTKEVGKGTGQGLAIAHSVVVTKHGGKVWFESGPGTGTKFFVCLPLPTLEPENDEVCMAAGSADL